jgi:hypothetical protein
MVAQKRGPTLPLSLTVSPLSRGEGIGQRAGVATSGFHGRVKPFGALGAFLQNSCLTQALARAPATLTSSLCPFAAFLNMSLAPHSRAFLNMSLAPHSAPHSRTPLAWLTTFVLRRNLRAMACVIRLPRSGNTWYERSGGADVALCRPPPRPRRPQPVERAVGTGIEAVWLATGDVNGDGRTDLPDRSGACGERQRRERLRSTGRGTTQTTNTAGQ